MREMIRKLSFATSVLLLITPANAQNVKDAANLRQSKIQKMNSANSTSNFKMGKVFSAPTVPQQRVNAEGKTIYSFFTSMENGGASFRKAELVAPLSFEAIPSTEIAMIEPSLSNSFIADNKFYHSDFNSNWSVYDASDDTEWKKEEGFSNNNLGILLYATFDQSENRVYCVTNIDDKNLWGYIESPVTKESTFSYICDFPNNISSIAGITSNGNGEIYAITYELDPLDYIATDKNLCKVNKGDFSLDVIGNLDNTPLACNTQPGIYNLLTYSSSTNSLWFGSTTSQLGDFGFESKSNLYQIDPVNLNAEYFGTFPSMPMTLIIPSSATEDSAAEVFGFKVSGEAGNNWFGVVNSTVKKPLSFSKVKETPSYNNSATFAYDEANCYVIEYGNVYLDGSMKYTQYDTESWEEIKTVTYEINSGSDIISNIAFNKNDNTFYTVASDMASWSSYLSKVTITETGIHTESIAETTLPAGVVTMCFAEGELYAILQNYELVKINLTTGSHTSVYQLEMGFMPSFSQNMCYDENTGCLLFSADNSDDMWNMYDYKIYSINLESGAYEVYYESTSEKITGLFLKNKTSNDPAPENIKDLNVTFSTPGALAAELSFTLPEIDKKGNVLTTVLYSISVNESTLVDFTEAKAGESVSSSIMFTETGNHIVRVSTYAGNSNVNKNSVTVFAGIDKVSAPTDAKFVLNDFKGIVTWNAPKTGINGGYIPVNDIVYDVYRYEGAATISNDKFIKVAEGIAETRFEETLPEVMNNYYYKICARIGETSSAPIATEGIICGYAPLPYYNDFSNQEDADFFTIINVNNDFDKWYLSYYQGCISMDYCYDGANDWLITPPVNAEEGYAYEFAFELKTSARQAEKLKVTFGNSANPESHTELGNVELLSTDYTKLSYTAEAKESGIIHFGIHAYDPNFHTAYIGSVSMIKSYSLKAPAIVDNLEITFETPGSLKATISGTAPLFANTGDKLDGDVTIIIRTGEENSADITEIVSPGKEFSKTITLSESGSKKITVLASNTFGEGKLTTRNIFAGYDAPMGMTISNFSIEGLNANISWSAPNASVNNGYFNPENVTYKVVRLPDSIVVAENIKETEYNDVIPEQMNKYSYCITPSANEVTGTSITTDFIIAGIPFETPYSATFNSLDNIALFTIEDVSGDGYIWNYYPSGYMNLSSYGENSDDDWFISPAIKGRTGYLYIVKAGMLSSANFDVSFKCTVGHQAKASEQSTLLGEVKDFCSTEVKLHEFYYLATSDEKLHFGITTGDKQSKYLRYKSISVESIETPSVRSLKSSITGNTVTLSWSAPLVDDNTGLELLGYNVYCNDLKVNNELIKTRNYSVTTEDGVQEFKVTAVYNLTESLPATESVNVAIEKTTESNISIYAAGKNIVVTGAENCSITVSSIEGSMVAEQSGRSKNIINVNAGIYIVKAGNMTSKIIIK